MFFFWCACRYWVSEVHFGSRNKCSVETQDSISEAMDVYAAFAKPCQFASFALGASRVGHLAGFGYCDGNMVQSHLALVAQAMFTVALADLPNSTRAQLTCVGSTVLMILACW